MRPVKWLIKVLGMLKRTYQLLKLTFQFLHKFLNTLRRWGFQLKLRATVRVTPMNRSAAILHTRDRDQQVATLHIVLCNQSCVVAYNY